ncbi:SusD-like starch-binding protein associating with outer membrane [Gelidibacter sediminis]|uniref:SusD-like starch-binding protein associating with outer membrane n=1 Tax=Gelidibacter sediminis TaxID=1608710 RepID=A0A4R7Q7L0_9FLAO|nr:SusD/RagB family nutrient-binding outer membrane lipoprotein [Gelidibacter sediminis]TDU43627.1 SusD-like starch-binding protein associating with outer membrane [Gelidibacter sediminis]
MKNILKTTFIALLILSVGSCSDEYFDVNTPSGTAQEELIRASDLMAPVILRTIQGQYSAELTFGNYAQNFVGQGGTAAGETSAASLWSNIYLYALPNLKVIKEKAAAANATHYGAVADILTAINLGIATDTWDNIPYREATQGEVNLFPAFDSQESIYNDIFSLLDNAIAALQAPDTSDLSLGSEDLIYGGDTDKWLRAAYTLKARYQLHLVNTGKVSANDVLNTVVNGFTSNDDDFQMSYNERTINPWYAQEIVARNTGNFHNDLASQLVSSMNGDYYPFQSGLLDIDPRLPRFGTTDAGSTEWKGFVSGGGGVSPDGTPGNARFVEGGYYTDIDSPIMIISYAEALFIKAEAAFLANGGTTTSMGSNATAYDAYLAGIAASMDKYDVDGTNYLADNAIAVGAANLMLHHIMKEKYIHNFLNPESFVDHRRYNFSDDVFTGLTIREEEDSSGEYAGQWFRRASYPSTELNRNRENVEANQQTPVTPVWWDALY